MTDTVRSFPQILALAPDQTTQDITPQDLRDMLVSICGCYAMLENSGIDNDMIIGLAPSWTEFGSAGAGAIDINGTPRVSPISAFSNANSNSDTISADSVTGRFSIPAGGGADGVYIAAYLLRVQPKTSGGILAMGIPDYVVTGIRKNAVTDIGGADQISIGPRPARQYDFLPVTQILSGGGTFYPPGPKEAWTAESLALMTETAVAGDTNKWDVQVVNRGASGAGTTDMFSPIKSTSTDATSAKTPKIWTFNAGTSVPANGQLEIQVTKNGSAAPIQYMVVRGYRTGEANSYSSGENLYSLFGWSLVNLSASDFVSVGGYGGTSAFAALTVKNGFAFLGRLK